MSPDYSVNHLPDRTAVHNIATRTVGLGLFGGMATHGVGGALTEKATTGSGGRHVINSHVNAISISGQKVAMEELDRREVFLLPSIFVTYGPVAASLPPPTTCCNSDWIDERAQLPAYPTSA